MTRKNNSLENVHCVRDAGVAGSNPATPTILFKHLLTTLFYVPQYVPHYATQGSRVTRSENF
jgi:hypothetical protein